MSTAGGEPAPTRTVGARNVRTGEYHRMLMLLPPSVRQMPMRRLGRSLQIRTIRPSVGILWRIITGVAIGPAAGQSRST